MKAIILAGGNGSRTRHIAGNLQQYMIKAGGKPFLQHIVDHLSESGQIDDIVICTGYDGKYIEHHFRDQDQDVLIDHLSPYVENGTRLLHAMERMNPHLDEPFLVCQGDTLLRTDIARLISAYESRNVPLMLTARDCRDIGYPNNMKVDVIRGLVREFVPSGGNAMEMGMSIIQLYEGIKPNRLAFRLTPRGNFSLRQLYEKAIPLNSCFEFIGAHWIEDTFLEVWSSQGIEKVMEVLS